MISLLTANKKQISNAIIVALSSLLFAYCINGNLYFRSIAFIFLFIIALVVYRNTSVIITARDVRSVFTYRNIFLYTLSVELGIIGALYYRYSYHMFLIPATIHYFALIAIGIAITEELLFRGFLQSQLERLNVTTAILFAALSHAVYKATIFLSPFAVQKINVPSLFIQSFIAYIILGYLKHYAKSVIPAIIVHVTFDIIVYAEITKAPWWVW